MPTHDDIATAMSNTKRDQVCEDCWFQLPTEPQRLPRPHVPTPPRESGDQLHSPPITLWFWHISAQ